MIQRLNASSLSFKANEPVSTRDAYDAKLDKNTQIAQNQNNMLEVIESQTSNGIPMQGSAQKLDVIA